MKKFIILFIAFIFVLAFALGQCNDNDTLDMIDEAEDVTDQSIEAEPEKKELAEPQNKTVDIPSVNSIEIPTILSDVSELILVRKAYKVSYNGDTKCPNWVAWHLTASHVDGDVPRYNRYDEDLDVPAPRATNEDYRGSGWSRGHMCPAGDNKWDAEAMRQSNLLTNMCPQNRSLNSGMWNRIEMDCRKWAQKYGDVYIVCGPLFYNKEHETIGTNKVVVPEAFFKVILCLNGKPKTIGFVVKNNEGAKKKDQYVNTVDQVERITGMDFFPALPDSIEDIVEATANINEW